MHTKHEQGRYAVRERALRSQLEDSLAAQAALAREHQLRQADLAERVRRLEAACAQTSTYLLVPRSREKLQGPCLSVSLHV